MKNTTAMRYYLTLNSMVKIKMTINIVLERIQSNEPSHTYKRMQPL